MRLGLAALALLLAAGLARAAPASASAPAPASAPAGAPEAGLDPLAAQATPVRLVATPDDDFADLAPFGAAVADARLVALDEQTHGGHEEFTLKLRLLRYLHEKRGFDALVLESGFFDVGRIQQSRASGAKVDDLAPDNIFFMVSKSSEGRALLQYVDATQSTAHPLVIAGMDSQHSGALSQKELVPRLADYLLAHGGREPKTPAWAGFAATVSAMTALQVARPSPEDLKGFGEVTRWAGLELGALSFKVPGKDDPVPSAIESGDWWARVLTDLRYQGEHLWSQPRANFRDQAMGDTVNWIADRQFPGQRVVAWGHAIHLMHDTPHAAGTAPFAGTVVRSRQGARYHVVHLTGLQGRYLDYTTLKPADIPVAAPGTLEARLATRPDVALYLAPPTHISPDAPVARFIDYAPFGALPGRGVNWESTFFIRDITPVTMVR